jgi:hypothetical protein
MLLSHDACVGIEIRIEIHLKGIYIDKYEYYAFSILKEFSMTAICLLDKKAFKSYILFT